MNEDDKDLEDLNWYAPPSPSVSIVQLLRVIDNSKLMKLFNRWISYEVLTYDYLLVLHLNYRSGLKYSSVSGIVPLLVLGTLVFS